MKYLLIILILLVTILGYGVFVKKIDLKKTSNSLPVIDSKNTNSLVKKSGNLDNTNTYSRNQIDNKTEESVVSFIAKVIGLPDKCEDCPSDLMCEPCKVVLSVVTAGGEEIIITPGKFSNFDTFPFLKHGESYKFTVEKKVIHPELTIYTLLDIK